MRKIALGVALAAAWSLATPLAVASPAQAHLSRALTIKAPGAVDAGTTVRLRGKVPARFSKVRIERRSNGRWVLVKRVRTRAHGRYVAKVRPKVGLTRFRAKAGGHRSAVHAVRVRRWPTPSPPPPTTGGTDECGARPLKADGTAWACTFVDDFTGTSLDRAKWTPQTQFASGSPSAHACYADDPSVINVGNGSLNLSVRKVANPVQCSFGEFTGPTDYLAGSVMTYHLFSQAYGRFEARIKNTATTAKGLHEAFWLWPDDRYPSNAVWPYAGEIDISETYSSYPGLAIPFLHYAADAYGAVPGLNTAWNCAAPRGEWNTYTLEWTALRLEIKVNGKTCLVNTSGDTAFQKPYLIALSQMLGAAGNEYTGGAPLPATMNVDYVKVWK